MPPKPPTDALRGSLDLLVLKTLSLTPMHGWGISQRIQQFSEGMLEVNQGSLYPALQRMEKSGLITSAWAGFTWASSMSSRIADRVAEPWSSTGTSASSRLSGRRKWLRSWSIHLNRAMVLSQGVIGSSG